MHPFVQTFIHSDYSLQGMLASMRDHPDPVVSTMMMQQKAMDGELNVDIAAIASEQIAPNIMDQELNILFLISWAWFSRYRLRFHEGQGILNRAKALLNEQTHPVLQSMVLQTEGDLASSLGNKNKRLELLRQALDILPKGHQRRDRVLVDLALYLGQQGRIADIHKELQELRDHLNNEESELGAEFVIAMFFNHVETGNMDAAERLISKIENNVELLEKRIVLDEIYRSDLLVLDSMFSDRNGNVGFQLSEQNESLPDWQRSVLELLSGRPQTALIHARNHFEQERASTSSNLKSYTLIRAEIAAGYPDAARHLMNKRADDGAEHYLDDLFHARIALLHQDRRKATEHFGLLMRNVDRYKARGRLDFELRMACELRPMDLLAMSQGHQTGGETSILSLEDAEKRKAVHGVDRLVGSSSGIKMVKQAILRFASLDSTVLITGETGCGKEVVAQALHEESEREHEPFVAVNCGAIAESLLEAELFGYVKGAFTGADKDREGLFEMAGKGTIFLDEIGDITPRLQVALLRVLEAHEVRRVGDSQRRQIDCRIIAATNVDLAQAVEEGKFRSDLRFRLLRLGINIPPLRERIEDIREIALHFLTEGRAPGEWVNLSDELLQALESYSWPGNVRELKNEIDRMRLLNSDKLFYGLEDFEPRHHEEMQRTVRARELMAMQGAVPSGHSNTALPNTNLPRGSESIRGMQHFQQGTLPPGQVNPQQNFNPQTGLTYSTPMSNVPMPSNVGFPLNEDISIPTSMDPNQLVNGGDGSGTLPLMGGMTNSSSAGIGGGQSRMRRLDRLKAMFDQYGKLTRSEIAQVLKVSPNTVTKDLKILCEEGVIKRVEPTPSPRTHYFERV